MTKAIIEAKKAAAQAVVAQELAFYWLGKIGYKVLLRDYECALGTVHMVAKSNGMLVFIEVCVNSFITADRREETGKVAAYYMKRYGIRDIAFRFDQVVAIIKKDEKPTFTVETYAQGGVS